MRSGRQKLCTALLCFRKALKEQYTFLTDNKDVLGSNVRTRPLVRHDTLL